MTVRAVTAGPLKAVTARSAAVLGAGPTLAAVALADEAITARAAPTLTAGAIPRPAWPVEPIAARSPAAVAARTVVKPIRALAARSVMLAAVRPVAVRPVLAVAASSLATAIAKAVITRPVAATPAVTASAAGTG
jgi:hypothetical protein